jgi:hypothetical protein
MFCGFKYICKKENEKLFYKKILTSLCGKVVNVKVNYLFYVCIIKSQKMNKAYPKHTLEKAIHCATRAVIRIELQKTQPIEDAFCAELEQSNIDAIIREAKQHYCEILTEVLGIENPEKQWENEWATFKQNSSKCTEIDGTSYQNLFFPILRLNLQQWLSQLLSGIEKQKKDLKIIERQGVSPAEGSRMIAEWLDIQQDFRECVVLCVALLCVNRPNAELWDAAQRVGEFYWQGLINYETADYYK